MLCNRRFIFRRKGRDVHRRSEFLDGSGVGLFIGPETLNFVDNDKKERIKQSYKMVG